MQVRPPMLPSYLFLIDVSYTAVQSGATAAACASISAILDDLQGGQPLSLLLLQCLANL